MSGTLNQPDIISGINRLAFVSDRSGTDNIWSINLDGSGLNQLTSDGVGYNVQPDWSPDGTKIIWNVNDYVWKMNADGSGKTKLMTSVGDAPVWSPDGTKIIFRSQRTNYNGWFYEYVMNSDGTGQTLLGSEGTECDQDWSPDSQKIVYAMAGYAGWPSDIYVMNVDGTQKVKIASGKIFCNSNAWSPDGSKIAYASEETGNREIFIINPDGTGKTQLTNNPSQDNFRPNDLSSVPRKTWSPDSQKIVFVSNRNGNWNVYSIKRDGTGITQLTNDAAIESAAQWSPDGTKIAYISDKSGKNAIWVMNSDGSNQVQVTDNVGNVQSLVWSPLSNSPPPITSISVSPSSATVSVGSTQLFTATDQDSNPISVDWSSSDPTVGIVSPATGTSTTFTAHKAGVATVKAASGSVVGSAGVMVEPKKLFFSGYEWEVRSTDTLEGPGKNYFSNNNENVWVDGEGQLHLNITKRLDGKWYSAEVYTTKSLGYGKYIFYTASRVDQLDKNVVAGLFTYLDDNHEIDIEFAKWGIEDLDNSQYAVQSAWRPNHNVKTFDTVLNGDYSTHSFDWESDKISFQSIHGHYKSPPNPSYVICCNGEIGEKWIFDESNLIDTHIPLPSNEKVHINLYLTDIDKDEIGDQPSNEQEAELIIKKFEFIPSVESITGRGTVYFDTSSGNIENLIAVDSSSKPEPPKGLNLHYGLFSFEITGVTVGGSATMTLIFPSNLPPGTAYWKYEPDHNPQWYRIPSTIEGNKLTITLTDGGNGDEDHITNGIIKDDGGPSIDNIAPATSISITETPGANNWFTSDVHVTLTASDVGGSGVATTEYTTDGVNWIPYTGTPFTISAEGTTTISYRSTDNSGNVEETKSQIISIDKTQPVITISGATDGSYYNSDVTPVITITDINLDTQSTTLNGASYTSSTAIPAEGSYTLVASAADKAGNNASQTISFVIDKTSPEAAIKFNATSKDIKVYDSETGTEAGYIVLPSKKEKKEKKDDGESDDGESYDDDEKGWELRQYTLNDHAANSLVLVLKHKNEGKEAQVKLVSTRYNGGAVINAVKNTIQAQYSEDKSGAIKELEQKLNAKGLFDAEAKYSVKKGKSEIKVKLEGQKEKKETRAGIVILELLTDKGGLKLRY